MRLIDVNTRTLVEFIDDTAPVPPYAILSHTWGADHEEISFQDLQKGEIGTRLGGDKLENCCLQALQDGLSYAWIDTCCIDKSNSTELGEAINSMFRWYKNAAICYAYLSDVTADEDFSNPESGFWRSRWFQRGWTLQELIAPSVMRFFDAAWNPLGLKRDLASSLVQISGVPRLFLLGIFPLSEASVAQRMSWASGRVTRRKEDLAYCLLGIFGITMPMIYGEGDQAFIRLQGEIIKHIADDSILAWDLQSHDAQQSQRSTPLSKGALAGKPLNFAYSNHLVPSDPRNGGGDEINAVGGSLSVRRRMQTDVRGHHYVVLHCHPDDQPDRSIGIPVIAVPGSADSYVRLCDEPSVLLPKETLRSDPQTIRILASDLEVRDSADRFYIENILEKHIQLTAVFPESCWERDRDLIVPNHEARSGRVRRMWVMFEQTHSPANFILVLEVIDTEPKTIRHRVVTCFNRINLQDIRHDMNNLEWNDINKQSASDGTLSLRVDVARRRVGKQDMFVVKIVPVMDIPDTYDITSDLQRLKAGRKLAEAVKRWREAELYAQFIDTAIKEKEAKMRPALEQLAQIESKMKALQEEKDRLLADKEGEDLCLTKLRDRSISLRVLSKTLQTQAKEIFHNTREYFPKPCASRIENGSDAVCEYMPDELDIAESQRKIFHSISEPMPKILMAAAQNGNVFQFRYFATRRRSIDVNSIEDPDGRSLLHAAALGRSKMIVQIVLNMGANMEHLDKYGQSVLHVTCQAGHFEMVRLLLDHGADTELALIRQSQDGDIDRERTPLVEAAALGHDAVVRVLLEHGAQVEPTGVNAVLPLVAAALNGHSATIAQLLDFGADVDARSRGGRTALTTAAAQGHDGVVRLLLHRGANKLLTDNAGFTARDLARERTTRKILDEWDAIRSSIGKPSRFSKIRASLGKWA